MEKLLTIAIPTFNRAEYLDKLLEWLAGAIKGFESDCEIFISDNCSSDHTPEVVKKWQNIIKNIEINYNRNNHNIGLMPNFAYCLQAPTSKYVWVLGDDDVIKDGTLEYVIKNLKNHPDLALLGLDYSIRSVLDNTMVHDRIFKSETEEVIADSKSVIEHYLITDHSGLAFISSIVYKTEAAKKALQKWPESIHNMEGQTYWTAFCALYGSIKISTEVYIEYASNMLFLSKPKAWFKMHYGEIIEVYAKLLEIGYSRKLFSQLILKHFKEKNNWKVVFGALRRWPILTLNIIVPYFNFVALSYLYSQLFWFGNFYKIKS
ncbi:glycosyltransferase [Fischerella muscicola CCMEE 5323]|uniref:Glycosyltransferase n=1 Tax=Fischerella muscicola CCMEE 5323 TaxID=2019572 RepID=A0A2N6K7F8_FISMU|nr:glycosyltransferase family 2 protein [Fischerella muscicola]PLZ93126.1 glycosyltransferase [Fischerella muscicola CCMEE 5323]